MNQISLFINNTNIIWIIPVFLFIHELEEWNILNWYKKHFINLPDSSNTSVKIHIFTLSALAFLLTFFASISPLVIRSILIIFLSTFVLTNTIQHAIQTFQFKTYAPGLATGILCSVASIFVNIILVMNEMIFAPIYIILLIGIPTIVKTIKYKNEMTPEIRRIHEFFIRVENSLRRENR